MVRQLLEVLDTQSGALHAATANVTRKTRDKPSNLYQQPPTRLVIRETAEVDVSEHQAARRDRYIKPVGVSSPHVRFSSSRMSLAVLVRVHANRSATRLRLGIKELNDAGLQRILGSNDAQSVLLYELFDNVRTVPELVG